MPVLIYTEGDLLTSPAQTLVKAARINYLNHDEDLKAINSWICISI